MEVNGSEIVRTSRAARPDLPAAAAGSTFHAACFAQQQELIADG